MSVVLFFLFLFGGVGRLGDRGRKTWVEGRKKDKVLTVCVHGGLGRTASATTSSTLRPAPSKESSRLRTW